MPREGQLGVGALCALGLLAFALHAANALLLTQTQGCESRALVCSAEEPRAWSTSDTQQYLRLAAQARERGPLGVDTMRRPPGYPWLLALLLTLLGAPTPALWLAAALAGLAAAAIGWLAANLSGSRAAGWAAGGLFCLWLNSYAYSALLLTDAPHAYLVVVALALSLAWRACERSSRALLAGAAWLAAQTLRPTFVALPLLLPLLLVKRGAGRRYRRISLGLWLVSLLVPGWLVAHNWLRHGVAAVSALPSGGLACEAAVRIRAELGEGRFRALRADCFERHRGRRYAERIPAEWREGLAVYRAHPGLALRLQLAELREQLLHPMAPYFKPQVEGLYPSWLRVGGRLLRIFWLGAAAATLWLLRRDPALGLFLLLTAGLVLGPASNIQSAGGRYRFVLDLLALPVLVAGAAVAMRKGREAAARRAVGERSADPR